MPTVKSFNDSSSVSLAYALGDGAGPADFTGQAFEYIPYTSEGFTMTKEPKTSTAITNDRRPRNSKNTKGSASGSVSVEFGAVGFVQDMISQALMDDWAQVDGADPLQGTFLKDADLKKFMCVEKTSKSGPLDADVQYHERYYGTAVNDATITFGDGEMISLALNFMSVFADYAEAAQNADGLGGSLALSKTAPPDYEVADSSNNLTTITVKDDQGATMPVVFSDLSMQIQNKIREQSALGAEFAAGMGFGKVAVSLSGEIYFYDQTLLDSHMTNKRLSAEFDISTSEGTYTFYLPNLMVQSPTNNSEGENQDYKTKLTLQAETGSVTIGANTFDCVIAVRYVAAP